LTETASSKVAQENFQALDKETTEALGKWIDVKSISLSNGTLTVIKPLKVQYGERDVLKRFPVARALVKYEMEAATLRVIKLKKRIPFLSPAIVLASGAVKYEILNQQNMKQQHIEVIKEHLIEEGNDSALAFPVRKKASLERSAETLREIGRRYRSE